MEVIEVTTRKQAQAFVSFPHRLYADYPNYIRPLDKDIHEVFDPEKNKFFRHGEATRWLLYNLEGHIVGRIAAFINRRTANTFDQPTGGIGFFECEDHQEAANLLFDTAKDWLAQRDMEAMDGPINFGERDKWWGLLVQGDYEPNYGMPYHPPYYQALFETYGFQLYFRQYTYYRTAYEPDTEDQSGRFEEKVVKKAERIFANPDYSFRHADKKQLDRYAEDFRTIYNKAWVKHGGVGAMKKVQSQAIMKQIKPVMDPEIMWFGYYKDEPVSFFLVLPELNQLFKHLNGKWNLWSKLKFLYLQRTGACKKMFGVVFGVVPEHQGKGMEAAVALRLSRHLWEEIPERYIDFEMNWIGDFNPKMMKVAQAVGGTVRKVHHTYRYLFDRTKEFKRAPTID